VVNVRASSTIFRLIALLIITLPLGCGSLSTDTKSNPPVPACTCSHSSCEPGNTGLVCNGCFYVAAPAEICSGADDDCDGLIDEDLFCGAPPPPPPGLTEPMPDDPGITIIYQDDMEAYTTLTEMGAYPGASGPRIVPHPSPITVSKPANPAVNEIITGRGGSGQALRLKYNGVYQGGASFLLMYAPDTANLDTHFFQYWARIGPVGFAGANIKWFLAWHKINDGTRVQWNTHWALGLGL